MRWGLSPPRSVSAGQVQLDAIRPAGARRRWLWRRRRAVQHGARGRDADSVNEAISALMALNAEVAEHEFTGKQILQMAFDVTSAAYQNGGL